MTQKLIFTTLVGTAIDELIDSLGAPQVAVVTDMNTAEMVLPILRRDSKYIDKAKIISIPSGDEHKNLDSLTEVWRQLAEMEATRSTIVVNLGGGVVSDLGGFAAATYKRGMRCINVPTTLLAAVDASVGGKTGINFNGIKNQLGAFSEPEASIISTIFFNTLPQQQILSGYAEMLKHALLENDEIFNKLLNYSPVYPLFDAYALMPLLEASVMVKARIVEQDLTDQDIRQALNFGHTIGHAFESFSYASGSPIAHGYAVAWGMVAELVLSHMILGFPSDKLHAYAAYVRKNYGAFAIDCKDYPALLAAMRQDKKNASADAVTFSLLENVGIPRIGQTATDEQITAALDIYRDLMGL